MGKMTGSCCVPFCKSNYKKGEYVPIFDFPKDESLKKKWLTQISRKNFKPTKCSKVCIKHFPEKFIVREHKTTRDDRSVLVVKHGKISLTKDAYPSIFEKTKNITTQPPKPRKSPEERRATLAALDDENYKKWISADKIENINQFIESLEERNISKTWLFIKSDKQVTFVKMRNIHNNESPKVITSFKIYSDLKTDIWHLDVALPTQKFNWLLGDKLKCDRWSKLDSLLSHLDSI